MGIFPGFGSITPRWRWRGPDRFVVVVIVVVTVVVIAESLPLAVGGRKWFGGKTNRCSSLVVGSTASIASFGKNPTRRWRGYGSYICAD